MKPKYQLLLLFLLGFGIFMFTRASKMVPTIPIAIIIAPIFILRFIRSQPAKRGILFTLLGFLLSMNIALWGLFDISNSTIMLVNDLVRSSLLAILYFIPYMIDRLIYPKFRGKGILSTLTFPVTITAIFFFSSLEGPFDGDTAKSIYAYGDILFQQISTLTGLWGFVFVFSWLASLINYAWENDFNWEKTKKGVFLYSFVIILVYLYGATKVFLFHPESGTVKMAATILVPEEEKAIPMERIFEDEITSPLEETLFKIEELTKEAVLNGAKIVTFQEFAVVIHEVDEENVQAFFKRTARENNTYLNVTYAYFSKADKGENKSLLIDPQGEIQIEYSKRYLLGFGKYGETGVFRKGAEVIQALDTPYGRIGVSICRDMGFPRYIRQAGEMNVDIMLGPSYDWPKSTGPVYHLRAIEYGFSFVRPTYNGFTFAEDYNGRILAEMGFDEALDGIMYVEAPTRGILTLYSAVGDVFAWICIAVMLIFIGLAVTNKLNRNPIKTTP